MGDLGALGDYSGDFHLWPAMDGWDGGAPRADAGGGGAPGAGATFEVAPDGECCVCLDRPIATSCLHPCGHIAMCEGARTGSGPRRCPICRTNIREISVRAPPADDAAAFEAALT